MKIIIMFIITFIMNWPAHALVRLIVEFKNWLNSSVLVLNSPIILFSSDEITQTASHGCVVCVLLMF